MKIALIWFVISALISVALLTKMPGYSSIASKMNNAIKISSELQLLEELKKLDIINKDVLQVKYREIHKDYKQAVIDSQIKGLPETVLYISLITLNLLNILVVIALSLLSYKNHLKKKALIHE